MSQEFMPCFEHVKYSYAETIMSVRTVETLWDKIVYMSSQMQTAWMKYTVYFQVLLCFLTAMQIDIRR